MRGRRRVDGKPVRVSDREIANQSAERIYLPAPFAKRNLFYLRNVKFATCVVPSVNVTCNCLQLGAQDFGVCQL